MRISPNAARRLEEGMVLISYWHSTYFYLVY
jgi:hypothetical protein